MNKTAMFIGALSLLAAARVGATVPSGFSVQGVLRNGTGQLQSMPVNVTVTLYDGQASTTVVGGPYVQSSVPVQGGLFTVAIDDAGLTASLASKSQVWLEVAAGNDTFPRQKVTPELFALFAGTADVANSLSCSGCVTDAMIGGSISGGKVGKVAQSAAADTATSATTATTATNFSGDLAGDVTGKQATTKVTKLQNVAVASTAPTNNQLLKYDGSSSNSWVPFTLGSHTHTPSLTPTVGAITTITNNAVGNACVTPTCTNGVVIPGTCTTTGCGAGGAPCLAPLLEGTSLNAGTFCCAYSNTTGGDASAKATAYCLTLGATSLP